MGRSYGPDPGTQQPAEPPRYSREWASSLACRALSAKRHEAQVTGALAGHTLLGRGAASARVMTCANAFGCGASSRATCKGWRRCFLPSLSGLLPLQMLE